MADERQIHAMLHHHLDGAGRERRRREDEEKPARRKNRASAERSSATIVATSSGIDEQRIRRDICRPLNPKRSVLEDQRMGPGRERKITRHRLELGKRIRPERNAGANPHRAAAISSGAHDQRGENQPRCRQSKMITQTLPQRRLNEPARKVRS